MKKFLVLFIVLFSLSSNAKEYSDEEIEKFDKMCIEQNKQEKTAYDTNHKNDYKVKDKYKFFCEDDAVYQIKPFGKNKEYLLVLCQEIGGLHYSYYEGADISDDGTPNCDKYANMRASLAVWKKNRQGIFEDILYRPALGSANGYERASMYSNITVKGNYFTVEYYQEPSYVDDYYTFREKDGEIYLHRISSTEYTEGDTGVKSEVIVDYQYKKGDKLINIKDFKGFNSNDGIIYK